MPEPIPRAPGVLTELGWRWRALSDKEGARRHLVPLPTAVMQVTPCGRIVARWGTYTRPGAARCPACLDENGGVVEA